MDAISVRYAAAPAYSFPTVVHPNYHSHPYDEMLIIHSGDVIAMASNAYLAHKGSCVLFYKKNCSHAQINGEGTPYERYYICFDRNLLADFFPDWSLFFTFCHEDAFLLPLDDAEESRLIAAARLLQQCIQSGEPDFCQRLLLCYIFAEVTEIGRKKGSSRPVSFDLTGVTQYIAEHLQEKLTIDGIAHEFHISRTKLTQDFRELFSMSVLQYITLARLSQAKLLLRCGETVLTAAEKCGFADSTHFIRVFRKYYGITPAKYRRQCSEIPISPPPGLD